MTLDVKSKSTDHNYDDEIIITVAVSSALSLIAVCLRLMSRRIKRVALSYDDYLII